MLTQADGGHSEDLAYLMFTKSFIPPGNNSAGFPRQHVDQARPCYLTPLAPSVSQPGSPLTTLSRRGGQGQLALCPLSFDYRLTGTGEDLNSAACPVIQSQHKAQHRLGCAQKETERALGVPAQHWHG